jgi:hypothetical protein
MCGNVENVEIENVLSLLFSAGMLRCGGRLDAGGWSGDIVRLRY